MKNDAAALVGVCLEKLETVVRVSTDRMCLDHKLADGQADLAITLEGEGGQTAEYGVKAIKRIIDGAVEVLRSKPEHKDSNTRKWLLFTPYTSKQLAESYRSCGIEFVDSAGNMHINLPWLKVFVSGYKPEHPIKGQTALDTTASLKIIYTLLACPGTANGTQRTWATAAGVALGSVGGVYQELRAKGYLRVQHSNGRIVREVVDSAQLLDRWLTGYGDRLRRKLLAGTYRLVGNQAVTEIVPALENAFGDQVLVGGELGATLLGPGHLHPGAATLHLDPAVDVKKLALRLRMVPDKDGNVTLLQTFGTANALDRGQHKGVPLAHPLLLYAELLQGTDPRTREFAREFYDARIKGTLP